MLNEALIREFKQVVGAGNVMDEEADRHCYAYDAAVLQREW